MEAPGADGQTIETFADMQRVVSANAGRTLTFQIDRGGTQWGKGKGAEWGLSLAAPVIVKYRDEKTELSLVLEDILR